MATVNVQTRRPAKPTVSAKASMAARAKARKAGKDKKTKRRDKDGNEKKQSRWKDEEFVEANKTLVQRAKAMVAESKEDRDPKKHLTLAGAIAMVKAEDEKKFAEKSGGKGKSDKDKPNESGDGKAGAGASKTAGGSKAPKVDEADKVDGGSAPKKRRG